MSRRSILEGTPTERYVFEVSTWWTRRVLRADIGDEKVTGDNQAEKMGFSSGSSQLPSDRAQITVSSDILSGIGAQFKTAQIHCHISASTQATLRVDLDIEIGMTADQGSVGANQRSSDDETRGDVSDRKNEEKITFNIESAKATIKTS